MTAYDPLHGPDEEHLFPASLDGELRLARTLLNDVATTNIHDHTAIMKAAVSLDYRLRSLLASLDAERGERR